MVEKGKTQEQADTEFDFLMFLIRHLGRARLSVGTPHGQQQAHVELELNLP